MTPHPSLPSRPQTGKGEGAMIGVGARGSGHAALIAKLEGVEFVAFCNLVEERAEIAA